MLARSEGSGVYVENMINVDDTGMMQACCYGIKYYDTKM